MNRFGAATLLGLAVLHGVGVPWFDAVLLVVSAWMFSAVVIAALDEEEHP